MKLQIHLFSLALLIISCNHTSNNLYQAQITQKVSSATLQGKWYLNKWAPYHTLMIGDSTIFVDNNVDTVFTLSYSLVADTLITRLPQTGKVCKHKILDITNEHLTLTGIGDLDESRTYSRTKKEF